MIDEVVEALTPGRRRSPRPAPTAVLGLPGRRWGAAAVAFVVAVVASLAVTGGGQGVRAPGEAGAGRVVRVVDGDTVVVDLGGKDEHVRLLGIDTPESVDPRSPVECFGKEATARAAALLPPGTEVLLVRDVEARDRYSRLLAYVYRADDGSFVNLALVADGFAAPLTYPPNVAHAGELGAAAAEARTDGRGLWGAC